MRITLICVITSDTGVPHMTRISAKTMKAAFFVFGATLAMTGAAHADDYVLTLKDHQFTPANLQIPADQKVKIIVKNASTEPAEFESSDFNREKIVSPGSEITVFIGPLSPGSYGYFDDFHRETTGIIIVK
jgi:plastocyanin